MPFQSEAQRRYLWANEPEIARDWTDTYGSGIAKALGGRIGFWNGSGNIRQQPHQPRDLLVQNNPYGTRPRYQPPGGGATSLGSGRDAPGSDRGPIDAPDRHGPVQPAIPSTGGDRIIDVAQRQKRQDIRDLIARQQAEKDYTPQGTRKVGPQLSLAGSGTGQRFGNWASSLAGGKIGGGLGSMLFGPWGALLGALFGRGVGRRGYQAYQTPEKETMQDILFGQNTLLSNLINKKKTPTTTGEGLGLYTDRIKKPGGTGIETVDIRDKFNRLGDDLSGIEGQEAKLTKLALAQYRVLQKKKAMEQYGGEKFTPTDQKFFDKLEKMNKEEKVYSKPILTAAHGGLIQWPR